MNWAQFRQNTGLRVQLLPVACRLGPSGNELPSIDDDWIISDVSEIGVRITNVRTGHFLTLGKDHIHHFTSNPDRSRNSVPHGFLTLLVQVFIRGDEVTVKPTPRPGEPVAPPRRVIEDKWVDFRYPVDSGVQARLEADGYRVRWCSDTRLSRALDLEGWAVVVTQDQNGIPVRLRLRDRPSDQTLVKKRTG
jgi:hypothetical protein